LKLWQLDVDWLKVKPEGELVLMVTVQPGAKKSEVVGTFGDRLKIKISAPPVEGAANKALINFISGELSLKQQQVKILSGESSRKKSIALLQVNDRCLEILGSWANGFKN